LAGGDGLSGRSRARRFSVINEKGTPCWQLSGSFKSLVPHSPSTAELIDAIWDSLGCCHCVVGSGSWPFGVRQRRGKAQPGPENTNGCAFSPRLQNAARQTTRKVSQSEEFFLPGVLASLTGHRYSVCKSPHFRQGWPEKPRATTAAQRNY